MKLYCRIADTRFMIDFWLTIVDVPTQFRCRFTLCRCAVQIDFRKRFENKNKQSIVHYYYQSGVQPFARELTLITWSIKRSRSSNLGTGKRKHCAEKKVK